MKLLIVKKGMATKAFLKYLAENNSKLILKQLKKGTVKIIEQ